MPTLLHDGYVVTMDAGRTIHDPGFVLVADDGRIAAVGPMTALPDAVEAERIDCRGSIVLPGLIDLFERPWTHLFPGAAPDETLARAMSLDEHAMAAGLAADALGESGITTVLAALPAGRDDCAAATRKALSEAGLRAILAVTSAEAAEAGDALLVETDVLARQSGRCNEATIQQAVTMARDRGLRCVSRLWPDGATAAAMEAARAAIGRSAPQHLMEMGVLEPGWLLVSPLGLSDMDRMLIRESGAAVVGLPLVEAAAGTGTTDFAALSRAGVCCGLGTDGPGRGWSTDMIEQMKWAVMSQNTLSLDVLTLSAERALEMATVDAARALGLEAEIGMLAPGMRADIAVFDLSGPHFGVSAKPVSHLVTCAKAGDAVLVLRDGRAIHRRDGARERQPVEPALAARARLHARAGRTAA